VPDTDTPYSQPQRPRGHRCKGCGWPHCRAEVKGIERRGAYDKHSIVYTLVVHCPHCQIKRVQRLSERVLGQSSQLDLALSTCHIVGTPPPKSHPLEARASEGQSITNEGDDLDG